MALELFTLDDKRRMNHCLENEATLNKNASISVAENLLEGNSERVMVQVGYDPELHELHLLFSNFEPCFTLSQKSHARCYTFMAPKIFRRWPELAKHTGRHRAVRTNKAIIIYIGSDPD